MVTKKGSTPSKMKQESPKKTEEWVEAKREQLHARLGLTFPVTRIQRYMKERGVAQRVSVKAAIAVASTLEFLCSEIMELAGDNLTEEGKVMRIRPRHLTLALKQDDELAEVLGPDAHIAMGGVIPYIEPEIEYQKPRRRKPKKEGEEEPEGDEESEGEED